MRSLPACGAVMAALVLGGDGAYAQEAATPQREPTPQRSAPQEAPDVELLEFLGSLDAEDEEMLEYLKESDVEAARRPTTAPPRPDTEKKDE